MKRRRGSRVVLHGCPRDAYLRVPNSFLRDPAVTAGAARVILWLASQAEEHDVYQCNGAAELGVGRHAFAAWVQQALASGYLRVEPTGDKDLRGHPTVVYHVDLRPKVTVENRPLEGSTPKVRVENRPLEGSKIDPQEDKGRKPSPTPIPAAQPTSPDGWTERTPLPASFQPEHSHVVMARKLDINITEALQQFLTTKAANKETRRNWSATFSSFIKDYAQGNPWPTYKPDDPPTSSPAPEANKHNRKRTTLPADWQPTDTHRTYAGRNSLDLTFEAEQFRTHYASKDERRVGWDDVFTAWLGRRVQWSRKRPQRERPRSRLEPPHEILRDPEALAKFYADIEAGWAQPERPKPTAPPLEILDDPEALDKFYAQFTPEGYEP